MGKKYSQRYYMGKTDEELDVLVAKAAGFKLSSFQGEGGWLDSEGALVQLESEFHPTSKTNFALELFREIAADGNGLALNTADALTKKDMFLFGGFDKNAETTLPLISFEIKDIGDFGSFRKTLLRGLCIFYIMYKNSRISDE